MVEQGRSRLSADENGRILDRLAGMEKIILPELVTQALAATGKQSTRRCPLTKGAVTSFGPKARLFACLDVYEGLQSW